MCSIKNSVSFKLKLFHKEITKLSKEGLQNLGLTYGNYLAMCYIYENPGITQVKLSEISYKDKNVVGRNIDKLEEKEYVKRESDKTDRRVYALYLTEKGKEIVENNRNIILKEEEKILNKISEKEKKVFLEILDKLVNQKEKLNGKHC